MKQTLTSTAAALLLLGWAPALHAAAFTWTGSGSDTNWTTAGNWQGGVAPVSTTTTDEISIPNNKTSNVNQAWAIKALTLNSNARVTGSALTLTGSIYAAYNGTVNNDIVLKTGAGLLQAGIKPYSLTLNGAVTSTDNVSISCRGGANVTINGQIATGSGALSLTDGTTVTLSNAANNYTGYTGAAYGTLSFNSIANAGTACAIGAGSAISMGQPYSGTSGTGTLKFTGTAGGSSNRNVYLLSNATGGAGIIENTVAGQTLSFSGNLQYDNTSYSAGAWKFTGSGNGLISGNIVTTGASVTKEGTGIWKLTGNNTYGGGTTVSVGTLLVSNAFGSGTGSGGVTVASGAILGGTGVIDPGAGNSVTINGTLAPGESAGTLTVGSLGSTNDVYLNGTYSAEIGDLLKVYGALSLGGSSILTLGGSPTPGTHYTLASYTGGLTGTFATINNLPAGWQVTYGSDAITLGLIPEPASLVLLAAAGGLLLGARRRAGPH